MKRIFSTLILILAGFISFAQSAEPAKVEMADVLHQNGKIYLVVLVLVTIFAGIIFQLIHIERTLRKLEKESKN